jgi:NAD(P)-dependent dehydrogenase (short-subunit alcohol dehydrogenase family)
MIWGRRSSPRASRHEPKTGASGDCAGTPHFGKLDVILNNAGYTLVDTVEEASEADVRALFDTN